MGNTITTHVQGLDLIPSRKLKEGIKDREGKEGRQAEFIQMNLTYFHITQSRFRKLLGRGGGCLSLVLVVAAIVAMRSPTAQVRCVTLSFCSIQ